MMKIKEEKGITIVVLMLAIVIMVIISSTLIYNAQTGAKVSGLNNMYNDIKLLKDKVDIYYAQYEKLPIIEEVYTNVENIKNFNENDNDNYYVIDLEALENLTLSYGKDYSAYKDSPSVAKKDLYIVNEQSHNVYYAEGIELDNKIYYTIPGEYTKVETETKCNHPMLATGMTPVKWDGEAFVETESYDAEWYNYIDASIEGQTSTSKWANAKTEDDSMWVWIPRFAYKITYKNKDDRSAGGTVDVVFLKGTTNCDYNGKDVTSNEYVDSLGNKRAYTVHPAFQDGTSNGFANGEWDNELTGFWVAKFEAGYANASTAKDSPEDLTVIYGYNGKKTTEVTSNYYGTRKIGDLIKYPVFQASTPSMNLLGISDAYKLSRSLTATGNPYGLKNADSHLMKNSEWGAVAYLTHSKYGRNGEEVRINNVSANGASTIYAVTGYGASTVNESENTTKTLAELIAPKQDGSWITTVGQNASSTGNVYGIYDLSGGTYEWTAGYLATAGSYEEYAGSLKGESNKYKSKYAGTSNTTNYYSATPNPLRLGEAIWETSDAGSGSNSWNNDCSNFWSADKPFSVRGGRWMDVRNAGIFSFSYYSGYCFSNIGFRTVLVAE